MKTQKTLLIDSLLFSVRQAASEAARFKHLKTEVLNRKPSQNQWSILECIEHLNLYGEFYLPEIERRLSDAPLSSKPDFRSGYIGNYFVNLVTVSSGLRAMKTPANKNPNGFELNIITIDRFLKQQDKLASLLEKARTVSLTDTKTNISLVPYVKIRLGDTLRFVVGHNERHIIQAKALAGFSKADSLY